MEETVKTESINRFIYIDNRFKCKENGAKKADDINEEFMDFAIHYHDFDELKSALLDKVTNLFKKKLAKIEKQDRKDFDFSKIDFQVNKISDAASLEKFIIFLINNTGIYLKSSCKVISLDHEYLYYNLKIMRFDFDSNVFFRKINYQTDNVIWEKTRSQTKYSHREYPSEKIKTIDDFYKYYK